MLLDLFDRAGIRGEVQLEVQELKVASGFGVDGVEHCLQEVGHGSPNVMVGQAAVRYFELIAAVLPEGSLTGAFIDDRAVIRVRVRNRPRIGMHDVAAGPGRS